jgi:hypothetical protein
MHEQTTTRWEQTTQPDNELTRLLTILFGDEPEHRAPVRPLRHREVA